MKTEIEIPVAELKSVLPGFGKVIAKKSTLPVLGCLKVSLDAGNGIQIQANNLDEIVTARLGTCCGGLSGQMLVPYSELSGVVKHCAGSDSIRLINEGKTTRIRYPAAGSFLERSLVHLPLEEWPPTPEVEAKPVILDGPVKMAMKEAFECAGTDASRYILNGACLDVTNKDAHYVVGTNGRHLYSANSFRFDLPQSLIIPTRKFLAWQELIDDGNWNLRFQPERKISKTQTKPAWLRLDSDHWTYIAKPIEGEYPEWRNAAVKPDGSWSRIILGENGVKTMLETLPLLPGADL